MFFLVLFQDKVKLEFFDTANMIVISVKSYTETSKLFERQFDFSVFLKEVHSGSVIGLPNLKTYVYI